MLFLWQRAQAAHGVRRGLRKQRRIRVKPCRQIPDPQGAVAHPALCAPDMNPGELRPWRF